MEGIDWRQQSPSGSESQSSSNLVPLAGTRRSRSVEDCEENAYDNILPTSASPLSAASVATTVPSAAVTAATTTTMGLAGQQSIFGTTMAFEASAVSSPLIDGCISGSDGGGGGGGGNVSKRMRRTHPATSISSSSSIESNLWGQARSCATATAATATATAAYDSGDMDTGPDVTLSSYSIDSTAAAAAGVAAVAGVAGAGPRQNSSGKIVFPGVTTYAPTNVRGLEPGKVMLWCRCGLTKSGPWCDGSHVGTSFRPLAWRVPDTPQSVYHICQCRHTQAPPFCDGTHTSIPIKVRLRQEYCHLQAQHLPENKLCEGCGWYPDW